LVDGLDSHDINLAILVDDFDFHGLDLMFLVCGLDAYALLSMSTIHNIFNPHDLNFISCLRILMFMFSTLNTKSPQFAPFFQFDGFG
jgi:hypothetical protein